MMRARSAKNGGEHCWKCGQDLGKPPAPPCNCGNSLCRICPKCRETLCSYDPAKKEKRPTRAPRGPASSNGVRMSPSANGKAVNAPAILDDLNSARYVLQASEGKPTFSNISKRLSPEWGEMFLLAEQDGFPGVESGLDAILLRNPDLAGVFRGALDGAKADPELPSEVSSDGEEFAEPFRLPIVGAAEFARTEYKIEWLIHGILVADQPCVVAAPKKGMKTSTMIDLTVALATGRPFLNFFEVPKPVPVLMLSGESGGFVTQETVQRVCLSRGVEDIGLMEGQFFIGFELPQLNVPEQLDELGRVIRENGIKAVVIDPLYLCLLSGSPDGRRIDAANLFDMGPLYLEISKTCLTAGATPLLVHHFKRNNVDAYAMPELDNVAYAGIQEFARQWILLGRRQRFVSGSGDHKLWLTIGGSAGHSGEWAYDVIEGSMDNDFRGRVWEVAIRPASEVNQELRATGDDRKDRSTNAREAKDAERVLGILQRDGVKTKTKLRDAAGLNSVRISRALYILEQDRHAIEPTEVEVSCNRGKRSQPGYRLIEFPTPGHQDSPGQNDDRPDVPTPNPDTGTEGGSPP